MRQLRLLMVLTTSIFLFGFTDRVNPDLWKFNYEHTRTYDLSPEADIQSYRPHYGFEVTDRNSDGDATRARITVLVDNETSAVGIAGEFNDWGKPIMLEPVPGTPDYAAEITVFHGMEYRLVVNGKQVLDPAAGVFTSPHLLRSMGKPVHNNLNSVFYDLDRKAAYRMQHQPVDLRGKSVVIGEAEVHAMVEKWWHNGQKGPRHLHETYRFVTQSGVIEHLRDQGYNAIEFLPFNASVDGQSWHLRYQVFGLFAPEGRYGSPDEFAQMIDAFNGAGIAVIMDAVVGHYPFQGNEGARSINDIGPHVWKKADNRALFGDRMSPWNTYRYDYSNPYMRKYLIDSIVTMFKRYRFSGIRFDNLDGIRFEPRGWEFLKELVTELRKYRPDVFLIGEMFFGENKVMKNVTQEGLGINTRTHSKLFDFVKDNMLKRTEDIDMNKLGKAVANPWYWEEAPRVNYITNHDESANRRDGATGQYPASLVDGGGKFYTQRKIMAFGAMAMFSGSFYLDLPQQRLLQRGTFYSNPGIDWELRGNEEAGPVYYFFKQASWVFRNNAAFAFRSFHERTVSHVDHDNKVIVLERYSQDTHKLTYITINLGHRGINHYRFGVSKGQTFRIALDSDKREFGGSNRMADVMRTGTIDADGKGSNGKPRSIIMPYLAPYGVAVFEQQ